MQLKNKQLSTSPDTDLVEDAVVRLARAGLVMSFARLTAVSSGLPLVAFGHGVAAPQRSQRAVVLSEPRGVRA